MTWKTELKQMLGSENVLLDDTAREKFSKDYYWYSPILERKLKDKIADCIALPSAEEELISLISFAVKKKVPITVRGAGTGNYGQAVPIEGGIVIDMTKFDKVLQIESNTVAVQAGIRIGNLERFLLQYRKELRIMPSTYMKSTVGGFVAGGSGGIGSITWGNLWDGNVLGAAVYTIEEHPRKLNISGDNLQHYIHNYGTLGVMTELQLPIEPKTDWMQVMVFHESLDEALRFSHIFAEKNSMKKRLLSVCEESLTKHFIPLKPYILPNKTLTMIEVDEKIKDDFMKIVKEYKGIVGHIIPAEQYRKGIRLSDFTWNHATLWAHKYEKNISYLQVEFDIDHLLDQVHLLKGQFGDEVQLHFEFIKRSGKIIPAALPVVRYTSYERLYKIIQFILDIGAKVHDPHTYLLGFGGWSLRMDKIIKLKRENDPYHLLNPGKITEIYSYPQLQS
ncbi:FAD linked oxidase domain protein [Bacillus methanolicus PB1]|uniref:FAD linked oxidase domain protein n=1 Tax=Bacillus methanolicus PB1 TaxID=997296 RepID=I3E1Q1_BACMT|nr:FAD-binding oxidoreductase [Bacillus methanolicus]EIJ80422.1 FAD linked oxidase domain protein [Bacillus methanolicus PB1]